MFLHHSSILIKNIGIEVETKFIEKIEWLKFYRVSDVKCEYVILNVRFNNS